MPAQLRPSRLEVTDRFPMLAFTLRSSDGARIAEVVLASDLSLFTRREGRNSGTFYSSREHGVLTIPPGGSVFTVPAEVLARFTGADRLYFGLATAPLPSGNDWTVDVMPGAESPYISLTGLTDRALRRVRVFPSAPRARLAPRSTVTEWAGDHLASPAAPAPAPVAPTPARDGSPSAAPVPYDDGFGPLPPLKADPSSSPAAPSVPADVPSAPTAVATQGLGRVGRGLGDEPDESDSKGIEGPVVDDPAAAPASAMAAGRTSPLTTAEYPGVTRIMASPNFTTGRRDTVIDRIVIHITSSPQRPSLGSWFMNPEAQASAHYMVDQNGAIIQFVREQDTAWHARRANRRSIGIEHVAVEQGGARYGSTVFPYDPPTEAEYRASAGLVAHLCRKYGLAPDRTTIVGHNEIDVGTTHTACPVGAWDWDGYMALVAECYAASSTGGVVGPVISQSLSGLAEVDPETRGVDAPPYTDDTPPALAAGLALGLAEYDRVARTVPSPAFTAGRAGTAIDRIVIHITDAPTTSSTVNTFSAANAQASAHYLVGQDGEIVQFVSEADTAWHARGANRRSIGIEHVAIKAGGADYPRRDGTMQHYDALPPTQLQYEESALLVSRLCDKYGLPKDRTTIIGHNEADPKTTHGACPTGNWDWDYFMRIVTSGQCQPDAPTAQAMIIDRDDVDKIERLRAGEWRDLFQWQDPPAIQAQVAARGFRIQKIEDAVGDLNLDFYKVRIDRFPPGMDGPALLAKFIQDTNSFLDPGICSFDAYGTGDLVTRLGPNPVGTCLNLDINRSAPFYDPRGWDDAAIIISDRFDNGTRDGFYAVTTINTPDTGDHPVSGHRQFGFMTDNGQVYFYTRGADRATLAFPGTEGSIYAGGDALWRSFQQATAAWINNAGGEATIVPPFSERFNPGAIGAMFGWGASTAQSLGAGGDTVEIKYRAFIPSPAIPGPYLDNFHGDDRGFSYSAGTSRGEITFTVDVSAGGGLSNLRVIDRHWGESHQYSASDTWAVDGKPDWWLGRNASATPNDSATLRADDDNLRAYLGAPGTTGNVLAVAENASIVSIAMAGSLPLLTGAPAIDADVSVLLRRTADGGIEARVYGSHDGFPCHELYVNGQALMTYDPVAAGNGPGSLLPPEDIDQDTRWTTVASAATSQGLARALDDESWTINWDDVEQIAQPTDMGCWATAAAMVVGWRDRVCVDPAMLARLNGCEPSLEDGLSPSTKRSFAAGVGLTVHPNACYTAEGFREILEANGPVWVTAKVVAPVRYIHAIVATGMYRENGQYFVRITDPMDRVVGTPGAPGSRTHPPTHETGSRYIMRWEDFVSEFEAAGDIDRIQLLHSGGTFGHAINRGSAAGAGYAQGLADEAGEAPPPPPGGDPAPRPPEYAITHSQVTRDGHSYDLAQMTGMVRPANALAGGAGMAPIPGARVALDDWPYIDGPGGRCQAGVAIDWQYDGAAVGNIAIAPSLTSKADHWVVDVRADIEPDSSAQDRASALVRVTTTFARAGEQDQIAVSEVTLSGDGRSKTRHCEEPSELPAASPPQVQTVEPAPQPVAA